MSGLLDTVLKMLLGHVVRSTLHFSLKNLRILKWSQSGKKGSKRLILYISMTIKVIQCIEIT